jgi:hypothetical protein
VRAHTGLIEMIIFARAQLISQRSRVSNSCKSWKWAGGGGPSLEIMKGAHSASLNADVGGKTGRMLINKDHPWNEIVLYYWRRQNNSATLLLLLLYHK